MLSSRAMTDSVRHLGFHGPLRRSLWRAFGLSTSLILFGLIPLGCGGSASETPPPLEPLPARTRATLEEAPPTDAPAAGSRGASGDGSDWSAGAGEPSATEPRGADPRGAQPSPRHHSGDAPATEERAPSTWGR